MENAIEAFAAWYAAQPHDLVAQMAGRGKRAGQLACVGLSRQGEFEMNIAGQQTYAAGREVLWARCTIRSSSHLCP